MTSILIYCIRQNNQGGLQWFELATQLVNVLLHIKQKTSNNHKLSFAVGPGSRKHVCEGCD